MTVKYDPSGFYKTMGIRIGKGGPGSGSWDGPGQPRGSQEVGGGEAASSAKVAFSKVDNEALRTIDMMSSSTLGRGQLSEIFKGASDGKHEVSISVYRSGGKPIVDAAFSSGGSRKGSVVATWEGKGVVRVQQYVVGKNTARDDKVIAKAREHVAKSLSDFGFKIKGNITEAEYEGRN